MEEKLLSILDEKTSLKINEIAKELKVERHTASKYLNKLEGEGKISYKYKGRSKIYSLVDNDFLEFIKKEDGASKTVKEILTKMDEHVSIQDKEFNVIWNNKIKANKKCYEIYANRKDKCPNCPAESVFLTGKTKKNLVNMKDDMNVEIRPIKNNIGETIAIIEIGKKV